MTSTKSKKDAPQKKPSSNPKPSTQRTQNKDLDLFRSAFLATVELIGLKAWNFTFHHRKITNAYAQVLPQSNVRYAEVRLACNVPMTEHEIIGSGVHEALHLLICDLAEMAEATFNEELVTQQEEIIVNSIEKALTPIIKQRIDHEGT